ncbi:MAG: UDP-N-acetylmuramate--alanine ligase [Alphaproteobacteria bacterium]|nr:UDP-N-acetylmuramate--alanine ligase [Alphaproteobacteria bacterium]
MVKKVSFCGISGSGMSALAQVLKAKGFEVSGSDRSFDQGKDEKNKKALEDIGIKIFKQDGSAVQKDTDFLYISTAVEESIPDVKKALQLGVKIQKRSDLLAQIFGEYKYGVAVGGTSGKTTLTAMIGYILDVALKKPTVINGGLLKNYSGQKGIENVILNNGDIAVIEADESDGSIEKYTPFISVVNNITIDHKPINELKKLFFDFAIKAKYAVVNADCENSKELLTLKNAKTFSIKDEKADICLSNIKPLKDGVSYQLKGKTFHLKLIGAFNVSNAAAAILTTSLLGVDVFKAAEILQNFSGTKRRLDVIGSKNNITVIDDFAHNPDKVKASISALKDYEGRVLVMFQPHGFSPMRMMGHQIIESFASTMDKDDVLFMPEIFYAGGSVKRDISSKDLIEYANSLNLNAEFYPLRDDIKNRILEITKQGDRIVIMGARDNTLPDFCKSILEEIKNA